MEFEDWDDEKKAYYEEANKELRFFSTPQMQMTNRTVSEFPRPEVVASPSSRRIKVGRNDPCPCGSGRKSKKCCGR